MFQCSVYKIVFRFSVFMCQFSLTGFANNKIRQSGGTKLVVAHKYNHKLTKEITSKLPRAKTLKNKFRSACWPYKDQGKTSVPSVDKNPSGVKREKPKLKSATYGNANIQDEMSVQIIRLDVLQCTA